MSALLIAGVPRSGTTWIGRALGHTENTAYVNEPDGFRDPLAFRTMLAYGENPVLEPGQAAPDVAALWAGAFAGGRPAGTVRDRLARALYERTPLDTLRAARAAGHASGKPGLAARLAVPRVAEPGARVVVKSVQSALALEWIADRFQPRVLIIERNPFNVLSSWNELGYVRNPRETAAVSAYTAKAVGHRAPGGVGSTPRAPGLPVRCPDVRVARGRSEPPRVDAHPPRRPLHRHGPALPHAGGGGGAGLGGAAERFLTDSDREGTPYRTQRRTEEQPDRWRDRLDADQVSLIRETLAGFPHAFVPEP